MPVHWRQRGSGRRKRKSKPAEIEEQNLLDTLFWPDLADMNTSVIKRKPRHVHRDLDRLQRLQEEAANEASVDAQPNINVGGRNIDQQSDAVNAGMETCPSPLSLKSMSVAEESAAKLNAMVCASEFFDKRSDPQLAVHRALVPEELNAELNAVNAEMEAHRPALSLHRMSLAEEVPAEYNALSAMASASQSLEDPQLEQRALSLNSTFMIKKAELNYLTAMPSASTYLEQESVPEAPYRAEEKLAAIGAEMKASPLRFATLQSSSTHRYDRHPCIPAQHQLKFSTNPFAVPSVTDFESMAYYDHLQQRASSDSTPPAHSERTGASILGCHDPFLPQEHSESRRFSDDIASRIKPENFAKDDQSLFSADFMQSSFAYTSKAGISYDFLQTKQDQASPSSSMEASRFGAACTSGTESTVVEVHTTKCGNTKEFGQCKSAPSGGPIKDAVELASIIPVSSSFSDATFSQTTLTFSGAKQHEPHSLPLYSSPLLGCSEINAPYVSSKSMHSPCEETKPAAQITPTMSSPLSHKVHAIEACPPLIPAKETSVSATLSATASSCMPKTVTQATLHTPGRGMCTPSTPARRSSYADVTRGGPNTPATRTLIPSTQVDQSPSPAIQSSPHTWTNPAKANTIEARPPLMHAKETSVSAILSATASSCMPKTVTQAALHAPGRGMSTPYTPARHSSYANVTRGGPNTPATRTPIPSTQVDQSPSPAIQNSLHTRTKPAKASRYTPVKGASSSHFRPSSTSHMAASPAKHPPPVYWKKTGKPPRSAPAKHKPPSRS